MFVFYEEDGGFKAGVVLADQNTSLQVETQHGKRAKIKATAVLLRFEHPGMDEFMDGARKLAGDEIDAAFLWECCGEDEFTFDTLARDYFGHAPVAPEAAAVVLKVARNADPFLQEGQGPLQAGAAGRAQVGAGESSSEKGCRPNSRRATKSSCQRTLPENFVADSAHYCTEPDKTSIEYKALEAVCAATHQSAPKLLEQCGALPSAHDYHLRRFLFEHFPRGTGFAADLRPPVRRICGCRSPARSALMTRPPAKSTTPFRCVSWPTGTPRLAFTLRRPRSACAPDSPLDERSLRRQSTVYMPGGKITMLPETVIAQFTLAEGASRPALSLYVELDPHLAIVGQRSVMELVPSLLPICAMRPWSTSSTKRRWRTNAWTIPMRPS